jgi:predicted RND superfamily exporter protein
MAGFGSGADHPGYPMLERIIFGNRGVVLAVFALITLGFLLAASQLRIDAGFRKQLPLQHEYMQTFVDYEAEFGGANRVFVALIDKRGDMFNKEFFTALEAATEAVKAIQEVDPARVRSVFTPNTRFVEIVEGGFAGGNVIPADFSTTAPGFDPSAQDFETIRENIVKANIVGRLVAKDFSGAMVQAELIPETAAAGGKLDYQAIGNKLEAIRTQLESDNVTVHIIGFAKVVDDIADGARSVMYFFLATILFTWLLLFIYSTSFKLATLTVVAAFIAVIWMLGALRLMGFGIDPMNMLTPFLIFAIAVSHGEQMINRYRGEIFFGGLEEGTPEELETRRGVESEEAAKRAFRRLLIPGSVALVAGCIGFGTILLIPVKMIFELAVTATVGVFLTIFTNLILLPILLSYTKLSNLPRKRAYRLRQITAFDHIWSFLTRFSRRGTAAVVIVLGITTWYFAHQHAAKMMVGDAADGVAELRPEARYNQDARLITERFALSTDIINIIAEVGPFACTESYSAMETIDRFAWHMQNTPGVQQVVTLSHVGRIVTAGYNEGSLKWRALPRNTEVMRQSLSAVETDSGLLDSPECRGMPIIVFTEDHKAETITGVVNAVKAFRSENGAFDVNFRVERAAAEEAATAKGEEFRTDKVNLRLATGSVGVAAAINETVSALEQPMLYLLYAAVFLMCVLSFKNPLAAACIVLPLILVTALGEALMVELSIGLKVNTLTVVALGVGIGVDYAIYIFARMRELMLQGKGLSQSYFEALKTTGIAIFYTALTLAVGVATWIFSELKFQADMGLMLTFMFVVNMIAAIVFLPALCRWLLRPFEKLDWEPPKS